MTGWMVTVAVVRDNDEIGHEKYIVANSDPEKAIQSALKASRGIAAVVNGEMDEASMKSTGLEAGGVLKVMDENSDPLTSRTKRHWARYGFAKNRQGSAPCEVWRSD
ncbi:MULTISPECIES: hypothetical protein [unclassified Bradyrhizobium]|uniref:hypothetical protein n=1 Tax=unclassified Bradyrhizobium TaxID=2631580 RepID=UPI0029165D54|nr:MULTISPECIES: hypothetical protein [unclassified Bradyrhizobium]